MNPSKRIKAEPEAEEITLIHDEDETEVAPETPLRHKDTKLVMKHVCGAQVGCVYRLRVLVSSSDAEALDAALRSHPCIEALRTDSDIFYIIHGLDRTGNVYLGTREVGGSALTLLRHGIFPTEEQWRPFVDWITPDRLRDIIWPLITPIKRRPDLVYALASRYNYDALEWLVTYETNAPRVMLHWAIALKWCKALDMSSNKILMPMDSKPMIGLEKLLRLYARGYREISSCKYSDSERYFIVLLHIFRYVSLRYPVKMTWEGEPWEQSPNLLRWLNILTAEGSKVLKIKFDEETLTRLASTMYCDKPELIAFIRRYHLSP